MTSWLEICLAAADGAGEKGKKTFVNILLHRKYKSKDKNTAKAHRGLTVGL